MKKIWFALFSVILLAGCGEEEAKQSVEFEVEQDTQESEPVEEYTPEEKAEIYRLEIDKYIGEFITIVAEVKGNQIEQDAPLTIERFTSAKNDLAIWTERYEKETTAPSGQEDAYETYLEMLNELDTALYYFDQETQVGDNSFLGETYQSIDRIESLLNQYKREMGIPVFGGISLDIVKNRPLAIGQRVFVYYNLHKGG